MDRNELIDRARELRLPNAKLFGEMNSLDEVFQNNPSLDELKKEVLEQERWNLQQRLSIIAVLSLAKTSMNKPRSAAATKM